jgi:hypothetical protein
VTCGRKTEFKHNELSYPWRRVILEKLIIAEAIGNSPCLMLQCIHVPSTGQCATFSNMLTFTVRRFQTIAWNERQTDNDKAGKVKSKAKVVCFRAIS